MAQLSRRVLLRSLAATCGLGAVATVAPVAAGADRSGGDSPDTTRAQNGTNRYTVSGLVSGADNSAVLNAAFAGAQDGDQLVIPPGNWPHASVLQLGTSGVTVDGYGAHLLATDPRHAGLHITGSRVTVRGVTHKVEGPTARGNGENFDDCPFSIDGAAGVVLEDVVSIGARDAGIFLYGAQEARLVNVQVRDSSADGIHLTGGCTSCVVTSPAVLSPGDDGVAVVSYADDPAVCSDIRIDNALVIDGQGRGVAVSGGDRVIVTRVDVRRSRGSGVYVASESGQFNTAAVTNCRVSGGSIDDANWDPALDTGSIGLFQLVSGSVTSNLVIEGISVTGSEKSASPYIKIGTSNGTGGRFDGLVVRNIVLPGGNVYLDGTQSTVTQDGAYTCASAGDGSSAASSTSSNTITSGAAATGSGVTLSLIRR